MSINPTAAAAECIATDLHGARVIGSIQIEDTGFKLEEGKTEAYREWSFMVAWQRDDQCGTHRVQVNNKGEAMAIHGHYDFASPNAAIEDMVNRLPRELKEIVSNA